MKRGGVLIYRCKRCGAHEKDVHVPDVDLFLSRLITGVPMPEEWSGKALFCGWKIWHRCNPLEVGISELVGAQYDEAQA